MVEQVRAEYLAVDAICSNTQCQQGLALFLLNAYLPAKKKANQASATVLDCMKLACMRMISSLGSPLVISQRILIQLVVEIFQRALEHISETAAAVEAALQRLTGDDFSLAFKDAKHFANPDICRWLGQADPAGTAAQCSDIAMSG